MSRVSNTNAPMARRIGVVAAASTFATGLVLAAPLAAPVSAAVIVVDTTNTIATADGRCGLNEAIANANRDDQLFSTECPAGSGADVITFDLPGVGPWVIEPPESGLVQVTETLTIDGSTQPGSTPGVPSIRIDHASVPAMSILDLSGSTGSTVRGLSFTNSGSFQSAIITGPGSTVVGNWIGVYLGEDGLEVEPNHFGIRSIAGDQVTIGGLDPADRNVIAGNQVGISIEGPSSDLLIVNNHIGTDPAGEVAIPNTEAGIATSGSVATPGGRIGDPVTGTGNVISGNSGPGIRFGTGSGGFTVVANRIGVSASGATSLPNSGPGVLIEGQSSGNTIGGSEDLGNEIANNGGGGVVVVSGSGNAVFANAMRDNVGLGIDLGADGPTANDPGDGDAPSIFDGDAPDVPLDDPFFPNNLQNAPVLSSATVTGTVADIQVSLDSDEADTRYPVLVDFSLADGSPSAQGLRYLTSRVLVEQGTFAVELDGLDDLGIGVGDRLVATARDANGNTSEFSAPVTLSNVAPFVVDRDDDAPDADVGDGLCAAAGGGCTLRAAMTEANAAPGPNSIAFSFPGAGVVTIRPDDELPGVFGELTIDGTTAPGASCANWPPTLRIILDVSDVGFSGLRVGTGPLHLRGVVVNGTPPGNLVYLESASSGSTFRCNLFGTDVTGTGVVGSRQAAIWDNGSSGNVIGGTDPTDRNLFAGNSDEHIRMGGNDNVVQGNLFGTDVFGNGTLGTPTGSTILIAGRRNLIGGATAAAGNAIRVPTSFAGVDIWADGASGNTVRNNVIDGNGGLGINLGNDGGIVTFNHRGATTGPNEFQNYPVIAYATASPAGTRVGGRLDSLPSRSYTIDVYSSSACDPSGFGEGAFPLGSFTVTTDATGVATFDRTVASGSVEPNGVTVTATDDITGSTSEFSFCQALSSPNLTWVTAQPLSSGLTASQFITDRFQEKWFRIPVTPGAQVEVRLQGRVGSAVSLHRDPNPIYNGIVNPTTAAVLAAPPSDPAFLPSGSLPSGSLPSGSLPSGSLPSGSLPSGSLETGFLPSGSLPSGSLPSGSLPSGSLPSGSLPSGSLPSGSLPSGSLPSGSLPSGSLPSGSLPSGSLPSGSLAGYSAAARQSLLAVAMSPTATVQTIERNTFDLSEDLYVRVVGPYDIATPFQLTVTVTGGVCAAIAPITGDSPPVPVAAGVRSVILTDSSRLAGTSAQVAAALADLRAFALRDDVDGVVIDLADPVYARVAAANAQADASSNCPQAKNLVAEEIKAVIDAYRIANPVEYVVLAGSADVIPFHQVQDVAGLANERDYVPPVAPNTPTDAGLRSGLVKGQDFYGSADQLSVGGRTIDLPGLAVGRLVDGAADISIAIAAYVATDGIVRPGSSLVTGYDFVGDAAEVVRADLAAGIGAEPTTLIQAPGQAPSAPSAWTADELRTPLLSGDHDVVMMTGHFSAGNLLAADYRTILDASEIAGNPIDYADTIVLALGCHGGFSLPSTDLLADASPDPDWAKAFLRQRVAGFVAATGYAYGDTELTEYGERLFVELVRQLRTGTGTVSMGEALVAAKRIYVAETAQLTGLDEKTVVEMTLYGLPMMQVDMPGERLTGPVSDPIVSTPTPVGTTPGASVGLTATTVTVDQTTTERSVVLRDLAPGATGTVSTSYLEGRDGVVVRPFEPVLPQQIDDVSSAGRVLRGVALRSGRYVDTDGVVPFTSSPATEVSQPIRSYSSEVFTPNQVFMPNVADAVSGGATRLITMPSQYRSRTIGATDGTRRTWTEVEVGLYYLPDDWTSSAPDVIEAGVGSAPSITGASAAIDGTDVVFSVDAAADGGAGVQAVWVLYTGERGSPFHGVWAPLDLVADPSQPGRWSGRLALGGADPAQVRFMVQAVGGGGRTALATNLGRFYAVGATATPTPDTPVARVIVDAPASGAFAVPQTVRALVVDPFGMPVVGDVVEFDLGGQVALAITDADGRAAVSIAPITSPGPVDLQVSSRGRSDLVGGTTVVPFTIVRDLTTLELDGDGSVTPAGGLTDVRATLRDSQGRALGGKSIEFTVTGGSTTLVRTVKADAWGQASLGALSLPVGSYRVTATFGGGAISVDDVLYEPAAGAPIDVELNDVTPPTIDATATVGVAAAPYTAGTWVRDDVAVRFTCTDGPLGSGVASCGPDAIVTTPGVTDVVGTAIDGAGLTTSIGVGPIRIDRTAPTIAITTPVEGGTYAVGAALSATYSCTDAQAGMGTCVGTVPTGSALSTTTPGPRTFTVTATDSVGNTTSSTVSYTIVSANAAPVVAADFGVPGLQEIGMRGNLAVVTGSFTDVDGTGPYRASIRWSAGGVFTPFVLQGGGQFIGAWLYPRSGAYTVTVRICDASDACGTDDVLVRVGISQRVVPVRQCVVDRGAAAAPRYRAVFGYDNPAPFAIYAPIVPGVDNTVSPNPAWRGQPNVFLPGSRRNVFTADFTGSTRVTWTLQGTSVQARSTSPRC
jgi:hypothetical protein